MHNIFIKSIEYIGEKYFYKNDKFKSGVNIILGDNKHGKTTFTYLIMYALGINVNSFTKEDDDTIWEIFYDTNNYVLMKVLINKREYTLKRKIKDNSISVISDVSTKIYPINRKNGLFEKDKKTFSDWLLNVLDVDLIKIENIFSVEHYLNFDDLFRYSYYDQFTSKKQMISDFGVNKNIMKNSSQIKKFIFETLLSYSNHKYYSKLKNVKELEHQVRELKSTKSLKDKLYQQVFNYLDTDLKQYNYNELLEEIDNLRIKKNKLLNFPDNYDEKKEYISILKNKVIKIQEEILDKRLKEKELSRELKNAKKLYKNEREEISTLEELIALPTIYNSSDRVCPICGGDVKVQKGKCICGRNLKSDMYHFMYSKADYTDILKSKVSSNKTTLSVISNIIEEESKIKDSILIKEKELSSTFEEIDKITSECFSFDIETEIVSINKEICKLSEMSIKLKAVDEEYKSILKINNDIENLHKKLSKEKEALSVLENDKYQALQEHIRNFETILNSYFENYYKAIGEDFDYKFILNQEYSPIAGKRVNNKVVGKHIAYSSETEIKIYFYLTMLKYSISENSIIYPKILIIDTIKDNGIDNKSLRWIFEEIFKFDDKDCQIIMTSGYEEFECFENEYDNMIIERIGASKLLEKR